MFSLIPSDANDPQGLMRRKEPNKQTNHPPATELAALEHLKCDHSSTFIFHLIFFIPVGYQDIHKSMDDFEFRSDPITDYGVSCP